MSISVTFNSGHRLPLASEFFMARRPVVDREQNLVAHELMFCEIGADGGLAATGDEQPAAASVIADVCRHGMNRVIGDLSAILYIDADALMSDIFGFLPPQNVVLEIADLPQVTPEILERLAALVQEGFRFALALHDDTRDVRQLLPLIEGVRIDITGKDRAALAQCCDTFRGHEKKLLAEKVETHEQFRTCHELGFDLFQGYYFTRPQGLGGSKPCPSHLAMTELLALLASDADNAVIEDRLKGDVALSLSLLRLVNTPALSAHRIDSLHQALMALGRDQLQRLLQILLYADCDLQRRGMAPLLAQATMRGRLMELIAQKFRPGNRGIADTAFTVGIMSLMDAMFCMPLDDILRQVPVVDEVRDALLQRRGLFGHLLSLVEQTEWQKKADTLLLPAASRDMNLSYKDLYLLQLAAFEWTDHVRQGVH